MGQQIVSTQGGCDLTTETKSEFTSFRYSKPVKLVDCLLWIPRIYTLFLGTTLTGHRMPRRGMCNSSAGAWCRPKCHGCLWEHCFPLRCLLPEYITCNKAAFLWCQYRSQEQGISQLTLSTKYAKHFFFKLLLLLSCFSRIWLKVFFFLNQSKIAE